VIVLIILVGAVWNRRLIDGRIAHHRLCRSCFDALPSPPLSRHPKHAGHARSIRLQEPFADRPLGPREPHPTTATAALPLLRQLLQTRCDPNRRPAAPHSVDVASGLGLYGESTRVYVQWQVPAADAACVTSYTVQLLRESTGTLLANTSVPYHPKPTSSAAAAPKAQRSRLVSVGLTPGKALIDVPLRIRVVGVGPGGAGEAAEAEAPYRFVPVVRRYAAFNGSGSRSGGGSGGSSGSSSGSGNTTGFAFLQPCRHTVPGPPTRLEVTSLRPPRVSASVRVGGLASFNASVMHPAQRLPLLCIAACSPTNPHSRHHLNHQQATTPSTPSDSEITVFHPDTNNTMGCVTSYTLSIQDPSTNAIIDQISIPEPNPLALRTAYSYPASAPAARQLASGAQLDFRVVAVGAASSGSSTKGIGPPLLLRKWRMGSVPGGGRSICRDAAPGSVEGLTAIPFGVLWPGDQPPNTTTTMSPSSPSSAAASSPSSAGQQSSPSRFGQLPALRAAAAAAALQPPAPARASLMVRWSRPSGPECVSSYAVEVLGATHKAAAAPPPPLRGCGPSPVEVAGSASDLQVRLTCVVDAAFAAGAADETGGGSSSSNTTSGGSNTTSSSGSSSIKARRTFQVRVTPRNGDLSGRAASTPEVHLALRRVREAGGRYPGGSWELVEGEEGAGRRSSAGLGPPVATGGGAVWANDAYRSALGRQYRWNGSTGE